MLHIFHWANEWYSEKHYTKISINKKSIKTKYCINWYLVLYKWRLTKQPLLVIQASSVQGSPLLFPLLCTFLQRLSHQWHHKGGKGAGLASYSSCYKTLSTTINTKDCQYRFLDYFIEGSVFFQSYQWKTNHEMLLFWFTFKFV